MLFRSIEQFLRSSAASARHLSAGGIVALLVSILLTMYSVEQAFNRIWRVHSPKPRMSRFLIYWTTLTFGSLLMVSALATASALFSLPALAGIEARDLAGRVLRALPTLLELVAFTLAYWLIPHRRVLRRDALAGGMLATFLFEGLKWGFAIYLRNASYEQLYGALAVVPIFLIWIYTSWLAVLLGASLASSMSSFRQPPPNHP